ncbi:hypothetical protein [uncultured Aquimarina sp.]|uniref:hypothetical protein n=1 Tax=uncultured Aquimarina sp. TaxID=575652 RepID=UPI002604FBEB|nr:hypothetical protein [uncultured Aquimarina sp.]
MRLIAKKEKWQTRNSNNTITGFQILGILSMIVMVFGVILWYKKDKLFKDKITKKNYEDALEKPKIKENSKQEFVETGDDNEHKNLDSDTNL